MRAKPLPPAPACHVRTRIESDARQGAFIIPFGKEKLRVIASDGTQWAEAGFPPPAWEHVSVSLGHRTPTYEELMFVKNLWWRDDELVLQLHVPKDRHINCHPNCLHLWKPIGVVIPMPPPGTVGPK